MCIAQFSIDLGRLPPGSSRVRLEGQPESLGLPAGGGPGRIVGSFDIDRSGDRISVRGKLEAAARLECVRCLKGYESSVAVPFELFAERAGTGYRVDEEELERDDYMRFHDGR